MNGCMTKKGPRRLRGAGLPITGLRVTGLRDNGLLAGVLCPCWLVLAFLMLCIAVSAPLKAQDLSGKFGGFSSSSNQPIEIAADQLKVDDIKKTATFIGNVKAVQGDFEMRSKVLQVFYSGSAQGGKGASGKVQRLIARGTVLISTKDKQSATSEWANFDVNKQLITLGDQVVLTQGTNVIKGGQLLIDLKTRQSRFVNKKAQGRIQMKVDVQSQKKN